MICGVPGCDNPGLVWLRGHEAIEYTQGNRVFFPLDGERHIAKIRVRPPSQTAIGDLADASCD